MDRTFGAPSFLQALWADAPLINISAIAWLAVHTNLQIANPPRLDLAAASVSPLIVMIVVYLLRWRAAMFSEKLVAVLVMFGACAAMAVTFMVPSFPYFTFTLHWQPIVIANSIFLVVHAWAYGGWPRVALFCGSVTVYGAILAILGSALGYLTYGPQPWIIPGGSVPLTAVLIWFIAAYLVTWVGWTLRRDIAVLRRSIFASTCIAALVMLSLVLAVDPVGSALQLWHWHPALTAGLSGVPLWGFLAWVSAVCPLVWVLFQREIEEHLSPGGVAMPRHRRWLWRHLPGVLLMAALSLFGGAALCDGLSGPTFVILRSVLRLSRFSAAL